MRVGLQREIMFIKFPAAQGRACAVEKSMDAYGDGGQTQTHPCRAGRVPQT